MRLTDAQIHLWDGPDAPPHHHRAPFTIERAIVEMDAAGVSRAVNCPAIWDHGSNDYATQAAQRFPERFATMGWFPLTADTDRASVDVWMAKPGMVGLRFVLYDPQAGPILASGALDWIWQRADHLGLPIALMVMPQHLHLVAAIARRHPNMRLMLDHLAVGPFDRLPEAAAHLDRLLELAAITNIAVKATGVQSMATDGFPFMSTHDVLHRTFDAFGPHRMFWGTDITRIESSWSECVDMFVHELPWLHGRDLELVMGEAMSEWIGWP